MNMRRGFTLIEILIVVLIIATLSSLSMDLFRPCDEERIESAVRLFTRDVEWARSATLTNPDDPASIRLVQNGTGWFISRNSTPTVAMIGSDGSSMTRTMGVGMSEAATGVLIVSSNALQQKIEFEPFGGVRESPTSISAYLSDSGRKCLITFDRGTGAMRLAWSNP